MPIKPLRWILNVGLTLLIVIGGPTASGKTRVAAEVAKALGTEVVSADARNLSDGGAGTSRWLSYTALDVGGNELGRSYGCAEGKP